MLLLLAQKEDWEGKDFVRGEYFSEDSPCFWERTGEEQDMMAYEFYWRDKIGRDHIIGILPERRENPTRITQQSVMNWGRKVIGYDKDTKNIFWTMVVIDAAQVESWGLIPLSELRKKFYN